LVSVIAAGNNYVNFHVSKIKVILTIKNIFSKNFSCEIKLGSLLNDNPIIKIMILNVSTKL